MLDPTVRKLIGWPGPADRANCARRLAIMARPPHENRGNSVRHYSCIQVRDHQRIRRKFGYSSNGAANRFLFEFDSARRIRCFPHAPVFHASGERSSEKEPVAKFCAGFSAAFRAGSRKFRKLQECRLFFGSRQIFQVRQTGACPSTALRIVPSTNARGRDGKLGSPNNLKPLHIVRNEQISCRKTTDCHNSGGRMLLPGSPIARLAVHARIRLRGERNVWKNRSCD